MLKYLRMGNKRIKLIWWVLVVVTVITFVGGFIFLFGSGFDTGRQAQMTGALATVDGDHITNADFQAAVADQREAYRRQYKADPGDQETRMIESQAWRGVLIQHAMAHTAKQLGLKAHDEEVLITLQASPPQSLVSLPDFQTNGQFDPQKYAQAIRNPNINWAPFEQMVREQLPVRKLQERLLASVKLSQPELLWAYRRHFEKIALTIANVPAAADSHVAAPTQADMDRVYEKYKGRLSAPERVRIDLLTMTRKYTPDELKVAQEQAQDLVNRARQGQDFAQLAKDFSEGPGAAMGGEIGRVFQPSDFGPELAPKMAAMQKGQISDPIPQSGQVLILKCLDRVPNPGSTIPGLKVAQIIVKARSSEQSQRDQMAEMKKLRDRAKQVGLSKAATEKGYTTQRTAYFTYGNLPDQLYDAPDLGDWAFGEKPGAVSPVITGIDGSYLAQIADRREAGPVPKADMVEQLRALAEADIRTQLAKPKVDAMVQAIQHGKTLEQAAAGVGATVEKVPDLARDSQDPRIAPFPDAMGAAFVAPIGKAFGPFETPRGWLVLRVDGHVPPDTTSYDQLKGQIASQILQQRQQDFLQAWSNQQRLEAKVQDFRTP
jgi:peptidyl-prolyl cis-trans isomerase D